MIAHRAARTVLLCLATLSFQLSTLFAQSTAFTYQGRLNDNTGPVTGTYDLRFTLYDLASGGSSIAGPLTNSETAVSNGIFTVALDFGADVFTGPDRWMEIGVRVNGSGAFVTLSPRQPLTPSPYAIHALNAGSANSVASVAAMNITGTISDAQLNSNVARLNIPNTALPAMASPTVTAGFITSATIISGGAGYVTAPAVTINDTTGSNAVITATISGGSVTGLTVSNAGGGYSQSATLTIAPPPSNAYQVFSTLNFFNGSNVFSGVLVATNAGNVFNGRFTGDGTGLSNLTLVASNLFGTIPDTSLSSNVALLNGSPTFTGTVTAANFGGNGSGLSNLNAQTLGGLGVGQFWRVNGNAGTTAGPNFIGTTDNQPLELRVNGLRAARIEPTLNDASHSNIINLIHGSPVNFVAPGVFAATISGGGAGNFQGGAYTNTVASDIGTIAGGVGNSIAANSAGATISGGSRNRIQTLAPNALIAGGVDNTTQNGAGYSSIDGGYLNLIRTNANYSVIAGGYQNIVQVGSQNAAIGGGSQNVAAGDSATVAGGSFNNSLSNYTTIGGGWFNISREVFGTIAGGYRNNIGAYSATIGGGFQNTNSGTHSIVGGGEQNTIFPGAEWSVISGGRINAIEGGRDFNAVGGGFNNVIQANAQSATIGGGFGNRIGTNSQGSTIGGGESNGIGNNVGESTVGGGYGNIIYTNSALSTIGGGSGNIISNSAYSSTIAGGVGNRIEFGANGSTIAGGGYNTVGPGSYTSFIGAGNQNVIQSNAYFSMILGGFQNSVGTNASYSTVGGGSGNGIGRNSGSSFVGGGFNNVIETNAPFATIVAGAGNKISDSAARSVIGGGEFNIIGPNSIHSAIPGGYGNSITGRYCFAAGYNSRAVHDGSFVWSDGVFPGFSSTAPNQFSVRAGGGVLLAANVRIGTGAGDYRQLTLGGGNSDGFIYGSYQRWGDGIHMGYNYYADAGGGNHVVNSDGATSRISVGYGSIVLATGGVGAQPTTERLVVNTSSVTVNGTFNNFSDRHAKQDFAPVNPSQILDKVAQLPISRWSYKDDAATRHIGPMAQDFYAAFNVGTDERHIAPIDEGGVALAAVQGLNEVVKEKDARIAALEKSVAELKELVGKLAEKR